MFLTEDQDPEELKREANAKWAQVSGAASAAERVCYVNAFVWRRSPVQTHSAKTWVSTHAPNSTPAANTTPAPNTRAKRRRRTPFGDRR